MTLKSKVKRRKDGSYILSSKTKKSKTGDCIECGENPTTRDLLFRYNTEDLMLVQSHIEDHLTTYSSHESMTPKWCEKCQCLLQYSVNLKDSKRAT